MRERKYVLPERVTIDQLTSVWWGGLGYSIITGMYLFFDFDFDFDFFFAPCKSIFFKKGKLKMNNLKIFFD